MKKCIYIGSLYPDSIVESLIKYKTYVDFASNTYEHSLLHGLLQFVEIDEIIASPLIRLNFKKRKGYRSFQYEFENSKVYFVGTINIPFIKILIEFYEICKRLRLLLNKEENNVVVYSLHTPFLLAVLLNKRKIKNSIIIVPDLPQYMSTRKSIIKKIAKRLDRKIINYALNAFNSYVVLSDYMKEDLPIKKKVCIRIEGIYMQEHNIEKVNKNDRNTILYTGVISSRYGVFDLVKAFCLIPGDEYRLWLCGSTNEESLLNEYLRKDNRITYFGQLPKKEIRKMQRKASLLVNPRHSNEEFTKYSFPSKTMEYLASGTTTVMCKLPAIPEEYLQYLYFFEDESVEGMKNEIIRICTTDKQFLENRGKEASNFVLESKNERVQAKKIVELLK